MALRSGLEVRGPRLHTMHMILIPYIDPGTGNIAIGSAAPIVLGIAVAIVAFILKLFWRPLLGWIARIFKGKND